MTLKLKTSFFKDQEQALFYPAKYVSIAAGRRWGKTEGGEQWLLEELLMHPGLAGLWVDVSQNNIDRYYDRYFEPRLKPIQQFYKYDRQAQILRLPNKSFIDFRSAERPERIEGFGYKRVVLNEAGIILKKPQIWHNSIQPMCQGDDTQVRLIGTPKGRNLFHQFHIKGKTDDKQYKSFQFSAYTSPFWNKKELNNIQSQVPARVWKQEYMAEFIENDGVVFLGIKACIHDDPELDEGIQGHGYVMGLDLGRKKDYTAIIVVDVSSKKVVHIKRIIQRQWAYQKDIIRGIAQRFNNASIVLDATGIGDVILDDLISQGLSIRGVVYTNQVKSELIDNLATGIENMSLSFPENEDLINELESFDYEVNKTGKITYNAPEGLHDDLVNALALAYDELHNGVPTEVIKIESKKTFGSTLLKARF